ncbi:hypothetical protein SDC9_113688 [bioreactor metagenome]|uniref:Uncharacterized protein n=1 Tax=bioreactor metagenome TaxID=1076179 RepID=A0A645BNG2_9ZZZZ|nr:hypothetical protein [Oscillospiraceae bacterium]
MDKYFSITNGELPLGLGMALAQNIDAMQYFTSLLREEQQAIINKAHDVESKQEMQAFVDELSRKS